MIGPNKRSPLLWAKYSRSARRKIAGQQFRRFFSQTNYFPPDPMKLSQDLQKFFIRTNINFTVKQRWHNHENYYRISEGRGLFSIVTVEINLKKSSEILTFFTLNNFSGETVSQCLQETWIYVYSGIFDRCEIDQKECEHWNRVFWIHFRK